MMADDKGKLVAVELAPSPPPHASTAPERPRNCVACAQYHGSEGQGRLCLENEVRRLRRVLRDARDESETLDRFRSTLTRAFAFGLATPDARMLLDALLTKEGA